MAIKQNCKGRRGAKTSTREWNEREGAKGRDQGDDQYWSTLTATLLKSQINRILAEKKKKCEGGV